MSVHDQLAILRERKARGLVLINEAEMELAHVQEHPFEYPSLKLALKGPESRIKSYKAAMRRINAEVRQIMTGLTPEERSAIEKQQAAERQKRFRERRSVTRT